MNGVQIGRRAIRTGWAIRRSGTEQLKVGSEDEKEEVLFEFNFGEDLDRKFQNSKCSKS